MVWILNFFLLNSAFFWQFFSHVYTRKSFAAEWESLNFRLAAFLPEFVLLAIEF